MDNKGVQYATKKITTAHCGLYNNNNNPDVTITISAVAAGSEASYVSLSEILFWQNIFLIKTQI